MPRHTRPLRLLTMILLLTGGAGAARADDTAAPTLQGYHLEVLASDAVAVAVFFGGDALESQGGTLGATGDVMMATGGATYALGGPIIHAAHGNYGRAAISAGLRVLLPIIGGNIGAAFATCDHRDQLVDLCGFNEAVSGLVIGAAIAAAADNLLVVPGPIGKAEAAPPRTPALSLSPRIIASPDRTILGLGGRF